MNPYYIRYIFVIIVVIVAVITVVVIDHLFFTSEEEEKEIDDLIIRADEMISEFISTMDPENIVAILHPHGVRYVYLKKQNKYIRVLEANNMAHWAIHGDRVKITTKTKDVFFIPKSRTILSGNEIKTDDDMSHKLFEQMLKRMAEDNTKQEY